MQQFRQIPGAELERLARRQLSDYDAHSPGTVFDGKGIGLSLDDAYRLQIRTVRLRRGRGERVAGYKIGCVSEAIRRQLGIKHPVFGHVFEAEIHTSPAVLEATSFSHPGIEGEFAVRLSRQVRDPAELREAPQRFVREVFPVIELHNYLFRGPEPSAAELVANNALHAGVVRPSGPGVRAPTSPLEVRVSVGSSVDASAVVDPLATLPELVVRLAEFGIRPAAGDLLLTGSPLPLYAVESGDVVRVHCPGWGTVEATF